jgi:hypothetical protein
MMKRRSLKITKNIALTNFSKIKIKKKKMSILSQQ